VPTEPAPVYDLRTRYAREFGGRDGYVLAPTSTLGEMARFIGHERRHAAAASHA
jgi:hypothetical protein